MGVLSSASTFAAASRWVSGITCPQVFIVRLIWLCPRISITTATAPAALQARPGADGIGDPTYPQLGNSGYDVTHYDLNLTIGSIPKWELPELTGMVMITARATQDLSAFNLDFQGYTIQALTVAGDPADHARSAGELVITPTRGLSVGTTFTTTVQYSGVPAPSRRAIICGSTSGASVGWNRYANDGMYTFNVPSGASTWYPVNDHPRDKATYCFWITVPKLYVVAANGLLQRTIDHSTTTTYQ